jgi:putative phage-type endonuclease
MRVTQKLMTSETGRLWIRDRAFERTVRLYGKQDQRTDAWHAQRGTMVTASEVSKVWQTPASRLELLMKKLEPVTRSETNPSNAIPALVWGTRFEPVAKKIYEDTTGCEILDVGCCQHPVHTFLGASPDGLIVPRFADADPHRYGRLVEFKCPMSRARKDEIPSYYVHQMQMQMECTGIDECEYVEFRFKQVNFTEWQASTVTKGVFAVNPDGKVVYKPDDALLHEWMPGLADDYQYLWWILTDIKKDFVSKDPTWLSDHLPELRAFWDDVERHRRDGTKPDLPPPKIPTLDL